MLFSELQTAVARDARDPGNKTFDPTVIKEIVNAALTDIGRVIPERFQQDITPIADTLTYPVHVRGSDQLLTTPFGVAATDLFTSVAHGLVAGNAIRFTSLTGGAGLAAGVTYFVIATGLTVDAFKLSVTFGGASVDFTTDLSAGTFNRVGADSVIPEVELRRVELWDGTTVPPTYIMRLRPATGELVNSSHAGWDLWNGQLSLTNWMESFIDPAVHIIRVWGYSPYLPLTADAQVSGLSNEAEWALRDVARIEILQRLVASRGLFSQWQTRSGNTDTSMGALMSDLTQAQEAWRRKSRALLVLREVS